MAEDVLPKLRTRAVSSVIDIFERKPSGSGAVRAGKGFNLFISKNDMNDIIKFRTSLEISSLLIDGATATETVTVNFLVL